MKGHTRSIGIPPEVASTDTFTGAGVSACPAQEISATSPDQSPQHPSGERRFTKLKPGFGLQAESGSAQQIGGGVEPARIDRGTPSRLAPHRPGVKEANLRTRHERPASGDRRRNGELGQVL